MENLPLGLDLRVDTKNFQPGDTCKCGYWHRDVKRKLTGYESTIKYEALVIVEEKILEESEMAFIHKHLW